MLIANPNVLVERGATEKSPACSPTKIYTPLVVASPTTTAEPARRTDSVPVEVIIIDSSTVVSATEEVDPASPAIDIITESPATPDNPVTPILTGITMMSVDAPSNEPSGTHQENPASLTNLQMPSPRLTQFLRISQQDTSPELTPNVVKLGTTIEEEDFNMQTDDIPTVNYTIEQPGPNVPNISITRKEILALTNVLGRIPPSFLESTELETGPGFPISMVEYPPSPPFEPSTSTRTCALGASYPQLAQVETDLSELPVVRNKGQRTRYSQG